MYELLNELLEIVYIVDLDTYELLFINKAGKSCFQLDHPEGKNCYEVLHQEKSPCSFCNVKALKEEKFERWEHVNRIIGGSFVLRDAKMEWGGRNIKIGMAFRITDQAEQKKRMEYMADGEEMIIKSMRKLMSSGDVFCNLDEVLRLAGTFFHAECAYIFTLHNHVMCNSNLWHAPGSQGWEDLMKPEYIPSIPDWDAIFGERSYLVIAENEDVRTKYPELYRGLKGEQICNCLLVPLKLPEGCSGCIGIHNFSSEEMDINISLLCSMADFISHRLTLLNEQKRLEQLSYTDDLTGVMNRNAFVRDQKKYEKECLDSYGVVYIDVNDMKGMNERYGHEYGDHILMDVARKMLFCFGPQEVYRIGGDEFVALCPSVSEGEFIKKVKWLKSKMEEDHNYRISAGYQWSGKREEFAYLLGKADIMRDEDKKTYYHESAVHRRYRHRLDDAFGFTVPGAVRKMIEDGRFQIYLQPKYHVEADQISGAEALIRYCLPSGYIVSPEQFIPLLEEHHLIKEIDFWVFEQICRKLREWKKNGNKMVPVSVNFSRNTMSGHQFLTHLKEIWEQYDIEPELFEIEVTENSCGHNRENLTEMIRRMKEIGFQISIDDFGVKDANLALFTSVDFDVLKIDRSLVSDITVNRKAQAIIQSITDICGKMGIQMVVEGIETEEQLEVIKAMGCRYVQGYLFSKPLPMQKFEQILHQTMERGK